MLSGYELQWDGGVVAIIDILDNNIWIYNDLEPSEKFLLSSIASAIMLKRMQDVEKERNDGNDDEENFNLKRKINKKQDVELKN
jgi:hypothetical protein